jgi:ParB/RepB/Spo0J family partition protein
VKHPLATIAVGRIRVRGARRPLDRERVKSLGASIEELGLLNPITITLDDGSKDYWLVAGRHRLAAVTGIGWKEVPAIILDCGDLLCDLAEIDENLCRAELTPAQRAEATAKRKSIWEKLHPSATVAAKRAEGARKTNAKLGRGDAPDKMAEASATFTKETADRTGRSERSVRRDAMIGEALLTSPEAAEVVHSAPKPIAQSELRAIAQAKPEERKAAAEKAVEKATAPKAKRQVHPNVAKKDSPAIPPEPPSPKASAPVPVEPLSVSEHYTFTALVGRVTESQWEASTKGGVAASGMGPTDLDALAALIAVLREARR